jgi:hypothetical protein
MAGTGSEKLEPQAAVEAAAERVTLDVEAIGRQVDEMLSDALYWFPVRHHSPAVARHLEAAIAKRRPKLVFIEAPWEANELIPYVVDAKTKPPVAIYSSYRDDDNVLGLAGIESPAADIPARFACWYPLLEYSPEYVALRAAARVGAKGLFMDLPHHALLKPAAKELQLGEQEPLPGSVEATCAADPPPSAPRTERESERLIVESSFYQALAEVAGYRSWSEAWDSLFEFGRLADDHEAFRRELATFCAASRATSSPLLMQLDGTLERERFMLQTIRRGLEENGVRPEEAMVVSGGFHLFLDRSDQEPPPEIPPGTVYTTVMPYSFFQVSELSGYGAGNRAPQFYQLHWELTREGRKDDLLAEHVVAVLQQARKRGEPLSSADAISTSQHARMLAALRGRGTPVLDDIHDALVTCCCKGNPQDEGVHLLQAIDAADIGTRVGRVTPALGRLPMVNDFYAQLDTLDLGELLAKEKRLNVDLDKREDRDARRSAFLHRLRFLKVPIGEMAQTSTGELASGLIFRERWQLRWNPRIEPALVEQNLYGDTIEAASLARLREELARNEMDAGKACMGLVEAIDMDLPDLIRQAEEGCGKAIDSDVRFVSLSEALGYLLVVDRYATYRSLRRDMLEEMILRCYDRACFAVPEVASVPEDQQQAVVSALLALAEVVLRGDRERLDPSLFAAHVRTAAEESTVPFLRGAFLGLLAELRVISPQELAAEVAAHAKAPVERMIQAGDFLDGAMAVSRTSILLGAESLVGAIDELLRAAQWEAFLTMLPRMRAAFTRLHERQLESLASRVAERYGLKESEKLTQLCTSAEAAAVIARIDQHVARIMESWEL